jgi:hypothetical protein
VSSNTLRVTAAFDYYYSELSLLFLGFPSFGKLLTQVGLDLNRLPEPLSKVLDIKLSSLMVVIDLHDKSVSAISFSLTTTEPIVLIENVVSLTPTLAMQIENPTKAEASFEGSLNGDWNFEGIKFRTGVAYPSLAFHARMEERALSTKKLVQRLMPGVNLPALTFTTMEIEGNINDRTCSALIEAKITAGNGNETDNAWGFDPPGDTTIRLGCAVVFPPSPSKESIVLSACAVALTFPLAGVRILLSAEYVNGQDGLQFHGSTGPGQQIKIGELIAELAQKFNADRTSVPEAIDTLVFQNLALSFNTGKKKSFKFTGEAKLEIDGTPYDISVLVELTDKDENGKYQKRFGGTLAFGGAHFKFELKAGEVGAEFDAMWSRGVHRGLLDPGAVSDSPELSNLQSLLPPPKEATLKLSFGDDNKIKRLVLSCTLENGAKAAFLLARDSSVPKPQWFAALGLKPPRISTDDLGSLGSVLKPHSIALDKLLVVAATADAPNGEKFALDQGYPVTKGFLLRGALEFGAGRLRHNG